VTFNTPGSPVVVQHHSGTRPSDEPPFGTITYAAY
jgi:hypothetical protein